MTPDSGSLSSRFGLRNAEVRDLHFARETQEHVLRGHVPVDDPRRLPLLIPMAVRIVEPAAHFGDDVSREVNRQQAARSAKRVEQIVCVVAFDVLHHEDIGAIDAAEIEGLDDVSVAQPDGELRLVEKHGAEALIVRVVRVDPLDGHELFEPCGARRPAEIHLGHAASRETPKERVGSKGSWEIQGRHGALNRNLSNSIP